jgi:hypothetical protein
MKTDIITYIYYVSQLFIYLFIMYDCTNSYLHFKLLRIYQSTLKFNYFLSAGSTKELQKIAEFLDFVHRLAF